MNYSQEFSNIQSFFKTAIDLIEKKAHDYANVNDCFSNFKKIAIVCDIPVEKVFLVFLTVKISRLVELCSKENKNESKEDTLVDIANYAALYKTYLDDVKTNETK